MDLLNEDEQVERIKKWIKEYVPTIAISILIVVAGVFGWRYWQSHQYAKRANASNYYGQLLSSVMSNNPVEVKEEAQQLITNYSGTPYGALAALILAKQYIQEGKMPEAEQQLQWVMKNASAPSLKQIGRNRLARLLISLNKPQQALDTLKTVDDKAYTAAIEMIRGDAYVAMQKLEQAKKSYVLALKQLPKNSDSRSLLEMKIADLPG